MINLAMRHLRGRRRSGGFGGFDFNGADLGDIFGDIFGDMFRRRQKHEAAAMVR